jgi:hypothetical protein
MLKVALVDGAGIGLGLALCVVLLAFLSLTPSLSWIPEMPLLGAAVLFPLIACGVAGYRGSRRAGRTAAGALAGGVAGSFAGGVGGVSYVFFGKPLLNVAVGLVLGLLAGAFVGGFAALAGATAHRS